MNIKYILSHPIQYQSPLIKFLTKKGLKIKVLFRSDMSTRKYFDTGFKKKISWGTNLLDGFDYEYLNYVGPNKVDAIFPLTTDFTNKIIEKDTDIIWLHGIKNWYNLCIIFIAKIFKKKVFIRDETNHFSKKRSFLNKIFNYFFYKFIDNFIDVYLAIGSQNKKYYLDHNIKNKKIVIVPYTVDNNFFKKKKKFKKNQKLTYIFAAKLIKKKGANILLEAVNILNRNQKFYHNSEFLIIGDGYMKNSLQSYVKLKNLKNVKFIPFQNQNKLSKTYQKSDVFIIPSLYEPWGLTVNEAMAAENAIISSNAVASSYDLISNNVNGFRFKNGDSKDLANKILKIFKNRKKIKKYQSSSLEIISKWNFNQCFLGVQKAISKCR
jgi:glycosyltransferase involved in cell wall biosynthesis|tara:strand:+ start:1908 stop:3044 length:1137 start_codon:yes stop_codon:yes gene_type:complete